MLVATRVESGDGVRELRWTVRFRRAGARAAGVEARRRARDRDITTARARPRKGRRPRVRLRFGRSCAFGHARAHGLA